MKAALHASIINEDVLPSGCRSIIVLKKTTWFMAPCDVEQGDASKELFRLHVRAGSGWREGAYAKFRPIYEKCAALCQKEKEEDKGEGAEASKVTV